MSIGKFCNRNVACATRSTTIAAAAALMRKSHVGNVVVVDESAGGRRPVGIVTDRDIVIEVVAAGLDPAQVALSEVALRPPAESTLTTIKAALDRADHDGRGAVGSRQEARRRILRRGRVKVHECARRADTVDP